LNKIFRSIETDDNLTEGKAKLEATNKMLVCFAGSSHRRTILIFLSCGCGEKNVSDITKGIGEILSSNQKINIKQTLDRLQKDGLIEEDEKNIKLTGKGKELAKIFDINRKVYGDI